MFTTKELVKVAMMTTLIIILGFIPAIPLGFIPVPIVLQNLGVMLAGLMLGGKKGNLICFLIFSDWPFLTCFLRLTNNHSSIDGAICWLCYCLPSCAYCLFITLPQLVLKKHAISIPSSFNLRSCTG
ncbi:biotin transporter bioY [Streptococcus pyogenes]|nr:biotin transporter bioY [Streptococcus pyogenes]